MIPGLPDLGKILGGLGGGALGSLGAGDPAAQRNQTEAERARFAALLMNDRRQFGSAQLAYHQRALWLEHLWLEHGVTYTATDVGTFVVTSESPAPLAPSDPLVDLCPVLSEPDPVIPPDPWYRRWWIAFLRWLLRVLP